MTDNAASRFDVPDQAAAIAEALSEVMSAAERVAARFSREGDRILWEINFLDAVQKGVSRRLVGSVDTARAEDQSWRAIGEALGGISRQQAEQRFGKGRERQREWDRQNRAR
jgi:hypothetical protein